MCVQCSVIQPRVLSITVRLYDFSDPKMGLTAQCAKDLSEFSSKSGFVVQWAGGFFTALRARIMRTMCAVAPDRGATDRSQQGGAHLPLGKVEG